MLPKPFTKENLLNMLDVRQQWVPDRRAKGSVLSWIDVLIVCIWPHPDAQKHLDHLKLMQQMAEIPRALGFTDHQIQDALAQAVVISDEDGSGSESGQGGSGQPMNGHTGGGVLNPFSSYGLSDQDYVGMLQGIAMEKEGKRELEVVCDDGTVRFQEGESRRWIAFGRVGCTANTVTSEFESQLYNEAVPLFSANSVASSGPALRPTLSSRLDVLASTMHVSRRLCFRSSIPDLS